MSEINKNGLCFVPLGGAEEIGMNMYAYGCNGKWIVVDAGYGFLNDDYPGMDMCYASAQFLEEFKGNIEGLFITHGHEDHMGAVAHIWPTLQCKVYGTPFTLGLIKERLKEYKMENTLPLETVTPGQTIETDTFQVQFVPLVHSVPENCGLWLKTPHGNVFHATDWRFDDEKTAILPTDWNTLRKIGEEGLSLFVCDSTNILVSEHQQSEYDVRQHLLALIPQIRGGLIVTCFASNIMRLESLFKAAEIAGRTPVLLGRSLVKSAELAAELGYLKNLPKPHTPEEVQGLTADKALYICTGSQADYRSALSLIAKGESKYVKLSPEDTIIFSSKIIPGNEEKIERLQENLREQGVMVVNDETELVHASGHASQEDLQKMYALLKPEIVLPVHGDKRFIREHKRFALKCGVSQVFSAQNGDICLLRDKQISKIGEAFCDVIGVDRGRSVSLKSELVANRRRIAYNCSLFISLVIDKDNKVKDFKVTSVDILAADEWAKLAEKIVAELTPFIEQKLQEKNIPVISFQDAVRAKVRRYVHHATDVKPVVISHLYIEE